MTALASTITVEDDLDTLLMGLGLDSPDEIIIPAEEIIGETDLEAAVMSCESQDALAEHYEAEAAVVEDVAPVVDPMTDPSVLLSSAPLVPVEPEPVVAKPTAAEKAAIKAAAKAVKDAEKAAAKAAAALAKSSAAPVVKTAPVRKHYASKTERLTDKLGASLGDYTVLELADAVLTGDALAEKQAETLTAIKGAAAKVQNRVTFIMEFAAGKTAQLNAIAVTALTLLKADGKIVTGETGNLHLELMKKYTKDSASAMANSTLGALRVLKMISLSAKGEYVANPTSLFLMKINPMLGL